jgi:hypothetical protein
VLAFLVSKIFWRSKSWTFDEKGRKGGRGKIRKKERSKRRQREGRKEWEKRRGRTKGQKKRWKLRGQQWRSISNRSNYVKHYYSRKSEVFSVNSKLC